MEEVQVPLPLATASLQVEEERALEGRGAKLYGLEGAVAMAQQAQSEVLVSCAKVMMELWLAAEQEQVMLLEAWEGPGLEELGRREQLEEHLASARRAVCRDRKSVV